MPEADAFASANDGYTIVVAGNMNPAIHHPAWYKAIGALSDEELTQALGGGAEQTAQTTGPPVASPLGTIPGDAAICSPVFAQFTVGKMRLICVAQRWAISTYDQALLTRIRDIASAVFDALTQTPVSAYGINFNFHRETSVGNVGARMAQIVDATPIALLRALDGSRSAKLGYTIDQGARALNISVEPSVHGPYVIFISINAHHPIIPKEAGFYHFDLTPLLRESVDKDFHDARRVLSDLMLVFGGAK